ncbi:hypothetical protein PDIG_25140 [Penicillium digitatum PHI26]|uniref:Uncharacterized protein n=2 Tax=Penicillium digitatum TaxID=36651 RepID=K9GQY6_PEND2|nr:hypothetical protein PDIP_59630 [Penicillium digitatum Pd1]EKV10582.1 hypothetical protein PDIP_59630 [Penicillium digitatum Pd1]EKV15521.1 hypothetical protein PDIG_25140 [Penicillium digitatum PHI26]
MVRLAGYIGICARGDVDSSEYIVGYPSDEGFRSVSK